MTLESGSSGKKLNALQQFGNVFNSEAFARLHNHRKLLDIEVQTARELDQIKLDWVAAKADF